MNEAFKPQRNSNPNPGSGRIRSWLKQLKIHTMKKFRNALVGIFTRLSGLILFIIACFLMIIPFFSIFILFGINKTNVMMSTVMRIPMNMLFGDKAGDNLLVRDAIAKVM